MSDSTLNRTLTYPLHCKSESSILGYNEEAYDPGSRWYAIWTRSKQEKEVAAMLSALGIQHYLPLKSELRQWSDRMQRVWLPLFSGYLFVSLSSLKNSKLQVLRIPGVGAFVGNQTGPLSIPYQQIQGIRQVLTAGVECSVQPSVKQGDWVRVMRGALAGIEGTLVRIDSTSRLLISIEMINQSLSVNVLRSDVEVVGNNSVYAMHYGQSVAIPQVRH